MKDNRLTTFSELGLAEPLLRALAAEQYVTPTPIQAQAIPEIIAQRDLIGIADTGTGKTAAFSLPLLHRFGEDRKRAAPRACRALVLCPTRELAQQIADSLSTYGRGYRPRIAVVVGGTGYGDQTRNLVRGVDFLVATPGRLEDHLERGNITLDQTEVVVADEADRMLDLGFLPAIRRIVKALPANRQSLFFSATMPPEVRKLADGLLRDPISISVSTESPPLTRIEQKVITAEPKQKGGVLIDLLSHRPNELTLIFTRTKRGADRLVRSLGTAEIKAEALHGNKSQNQRQRTLAGFRAGRTRVLVATDLAARGIDIDGIGLVVNYDLPNVPETYVHRIGRTARAGASGHAVSLCSRDERSHLIAIEKLIKCRIPQAEGHLETVDETPEAVAAEAPRKSRRKPRRTQPTAQAQRAAPSNGQSKRKRAAKRQPDEQRKAPPPATDSSPQTDRNGHPLAGMAFLRRQPTEVGDRPVGRNQGGKNQRRERAQAR